MGIWFLFLFLFFLSGCSDPVQEMEKNLSELEAKPAATTGDGASALEEEVQKFLDWQKANPQETSTNVIDRASKLLNQRKLEKIGLVGKDVVVGVGGILKSLLPKTPTPPTTGATGTTGSTGVTGTTIGDVVSGIGNKLLGVDSPEYEEFACKDVNGNTVDVKKEGFSKLCVR